MTAEPIAAPSTPPEPIALNTKRSVIVPDGLGFKWETGRSGLVFRADRIHSYFGNELQSEIHVTVNDRHVHMNNWVITRQKDRESLVHTLESSPALKKWNLCSHEEWAEYVEQFCTGVVLKRRSRIQRFTTHAAPKQQLQFIIENLVIKGRRPNLLFAPGGSGKSYFVCALCVALLGHQGIGDLSVLSGIVPIYFDWEDEFQDFNDKTNTVARGYEIEVPKIEYRQMTGALPDQIYDIAKEISDCGANFGIIDSMSAAFGTISGGRGWDAVAQDGFDALAMIPDVTWLILGHVTKEFLKEPSGSVMGSIQNMNRAATAWELRTEQEPDADSVHMKFHHAKWNKTRKHGTIGMRMEFDDSVVRFESESADAIPANLVDRMTETLMGGYRFQTKDLATRLGVVPNSIRSAMTKTPHRFVRDKQGAISLNPSWDGTANDEQPSDLPFDSPANGSVSTGDDDVELPR